VTVTVTVTVLRSETRETREAMAKAIDKLQKIRIELNACYFEREAEIDGLLVALLAREHVLLLGPPGTAKSALARTLCEALDGGGYFQWLLTKFSTPDELFGPISLKGLENDEVRRITANKLPECHVGFLDEIFKANSAILNSTLTLVNEREFHNNGTPMKCPLLSLIGASNELPDGDDLGALYDRFLIRFWTDYVADRDSLKALMLATSEPSISTKISLKELGVLQNQVDKIKISADTAEAMLTIKSELESAGITASDRRWHKSVAIVKAFALLNWHVQVEEDDLLILEHMLWREPSQRTMVREKVGAVASPLTSEALAILDAAKEQHAELLKLEGQADFLVRGVEMRATLKEMRQRLQSSIDRSGGNARRAEKVVEEIKGIQIDVKRRSDRALD